MGNKSDTRVTTVLTDGIVDTADSDAEEDAITDDGILELCTELGVDPQDPVLLVLSFVMEAATMCVYTRDEFLRGFQKLHCRSLLDLKAQLPLLRRKLQNRDQFASIYSVRPRKDVPAMYLLLQWLLC